jgi:hypothetical protein
MAKDDDKRAPDPMWSDRIDPDQQPEGAAEEDEEPTPPEQGLPGR